MKEFLEKNKDKIKKIVSIIIFVAILFAIVVVSLTVVVDRIAENVLINLEQKSHFFKNNIDIVNILLENVQEKIRKLQELDKQIAEKIKKYEKELEEYNKIKIATDEEIKQYEKIFVDYNYSADRFKRDSTGGNNKNK